jgi:hypothetical protein
LLALILTSMLLVAAAAAAAQVLQTRAQLARRCLRHMLQDMADQRRGQIA